jgi:hypothetical protein
MTKSEIDKYFEDNYDIINRIANVLTKKNKRNYDHTILIGEAYLDVVTKRDRITDIDQLHRFIIAKISMESYKTMSKTNRENRKTTVDIDHVLINKEEIQYQFNIIDLYLQQENHSLLKYVAEAYIIQGHNTIRKFRTHFKIGQRDTIEIIKILKQRIYEYGKEI